MESHGRIIALHEGRASVELPVAAACGGCGAKSTCGSGQVRLIDIPAPDHARLGDAITLTMATGNLNKGALVAYLLPAITTLTGAVVLASGGDNLAVIGAALGLATGMAAVRLINRALPHLGQPTCGSGDSPAAHPLPHSSI